MPLTANIVLIVPPLPDADVWFANAAAWANYWRNITAQVQFDSATNALYVPVPLNTLIEYVAIDIGGTIYNLVPQAMFESLRDRVNAMEANYQDLRTAMKNAGFISQAQ